VNNILHFRPRKPCAARLDQTAQELFEIWRSKTLGARRTTIRFLRIEIVSRAPHTE
jgi:hypothetical protein